MHGGSIIREASEGSQRYDMYNILCGFILNVMARPRARRPLFLLGMRVTSIIQENWKHWNLQEDKFAGIYAQCTLLVPRWYNIVEEHYTSSLTHQVKNLASKYFEVR